MRNKVLIISLSAIEILLIIILGFNLQDKIYGDGVYTTFISEIDGRKNVIENSLDNFIVPKRNADMLHRVPDWDDTLEITYHHNNIGARDVNDITLNKPDDTYRIVLLGDSMIYGFFVNFEDTIGHQLSTLLKNNLICEDINKFEIINLAYPTYDIQYALSRFIADGIFLQPDLIIWNINPNDLDEIGEQVYQVYKDDWEKWRYIKSEILRKDGFASTQEFQLSKLKQIRDYYLGDILVYNTTHLSADTRTLERYFKPLEQSAYQINANYLSIDNKFLIKTGEFPDQHLDDVGNEFVAQNLYQNIVNNLLTNCEVND